MVNTQPEFNLPATDLVSVVDHISLIEVLISIMTRDQSTFGEMAAIYQRVDLATIDNDQGRGRHTMLTEKL